MKVKLSFEQIIDIANLNIMNTGFSYESAKSAYPYPKGIIIDAEPIETETQISAPEGMILAIK